MAALMAAHAGQSLPKQMRTWSDVKAAYRFLNNERIPPQQIGAAHRVWTRRQCAGRKLVLLVQDDTEIHGVKVAGGRGGEWGEVLHTTLAVTPEGQLLGLMDQRWFAHVVPAKCETRRQRMARWRESDVWPDAARAIAAAGVVPAECRYVEVADRASDNLVFLQACRQVGHGFVVRAQHDRCVEENTACLWTHMNQQPSGGTLTAHLGRQQPKGGKPGRAERCAVLSVRHATVTLRPPKNHPTTAPAQSVQVVYLKEERPPEGVEAVDWMLLTSEPVSNFQDACVIAGYYQCRWVIEEWHRCLKEGCRLEHCQVETIEALRRLSALLSVIAVRMLRLRDLAEGQKQTDPQVLQESVPTSWITVVATLAEIRPETLTPRAFWMTIAGQGGFLARTRDGRPGWKVIWRGWYDISHMVRYAELLERNNTRPKSCG
jgi:hypothetical protein